MMMTLGVLCSFPLQLNPAISSLKEEWAAWDTGHQDQHQDQDRGTLIEEGAHGTTLDVNIGSESISRELSLHAAFFDSREALEETVARSALTVTFAVISATLANDLGKFVSVVGAFFGIPLAYIFPVLIHIKLIKPGPVMYATNCCVALLGSIVCIAASFVVLFRWDELKN